MLAYQTILNGDLPIAWEKQRTDHHARCCGCYEVFPGRHMIYVIGTLCMDCIRERYPIEAVTGP